MTAPLRSHGVNVVSRARQCDSKRRYPDEYTARAMGRSQCEMQPGLNLWTYQCPLCAGWHLTRNKASKMYNVNYDFKEAT